MENTKRPIISFRDLEVYKNSYQYSLIIMTKIILKLPRSEKYDLADQLSRSCKAIPRLIAEGYAKRHQKFGFQKYLDDALAESNETIVSLEQSKDIYGHLVDKNLCDDLIKKYDILSKQIYTLRVAWKNFNS